MDETQPQVPQKLQDFQKELGELCDKYNYELRAVLQIPQNGQGIFPALQCFDKTPQNVGVPLSQAPADPDADASDDTKKNEDTSSEESVSGDVSTSPAPDNGTPVVDTPQDNNNPVVDNNQ